MRLGEETIEQIKVVEYLKHHKVPFWHFANEGKRTYQNALILKRMGLKPGVADLFMPRKNTEYSGLWLEMKAKNGKLTPLQKEFLETMIEEGYMASVAYGAEQAIEIINRFYDINPISAS